ncbi:MAG: hypothetical protein AAB691_04325 [Patescibacteria group bacterium]
MFRPSRRAKDILAMLSFTEWRQPHIPKFGGPKKRFRRYLKQLQGHGLIEGRRSDLKNFPPKGDQKPYRVTEYRRRSTA